MITWPDVAQKANHFSQKLVLPVQVEKKKLTSEMKNQIHCLKKVKIQTHLLRITKILNFGYVFEILTKLCTDVSFIIQLIKLSKALSNNFTAA